MNSSDSISFNEIEICYHHIEIAMAKMNELYPLVRNDSDITKIFQKSSTKKNIQNIQIAVQNRTPLPKVSFPSEIIENEQIQLANKSIIYLLNYLQLVKNQILKYKETTISAAFKSNQLLTIRFCHLFVIFAKIVFYFFNFPTCYQIILAFCTPASNKGEKHQDNGLLELVIECSFNHLKYLSQSLCHVKSFIQNIISELANTVIAFNNNYSFEKLSIFYCEPPKMTTLPSLEYILMMNYSVIIDMCQFLFVIFTDLITSNQSLARAVFSESDIIYLSSNVLFEFDLQTIISIFRSEIFQSEMTDEATIQLKKQILYESQKSHVKRIKYILCLLKDYLNFAQFGFDYVMDNYIKLIALTNFSIYEISTVLLRYKQIPDGDFNFILELLTTIVDLIDLMNSKNDDIKRYYLFNLATNDLQYLIEGMKEFQMLENPSSDLMPMIDLENYGLNDKAKFLPIIYNELYRMAESLKIIDIEKYDSGENYCFTPFYVNAGRLLCYYFKNMHSSSGEFANKILEHLNTIIIHISFVETQYSSFCNFSNLSQHIKNIVEDNCAKIKVLSINNYATLLRILDLLAKDPTISKEAQDKVIFENQNLIGIAVSKIQSHFGDILSTTSPYMNISSYSSTPILLYNKSRSNLVRFYDQNLTNDRKEKQTELMRINYEIYDFYDRILNTSNLSSQRLIFMNPILKNLPVLAFHSAKMSNDYSKEVKLSVIDIQRTNYALIEYFWPYYNLFNLPFKRVMYNMRLGQSMTPNDANFLGQFNKYDGNAGQTMTDDQKLFIKYSNYLEEFFNDKQYTKIIYQAANNGFFPSQCLSAAALRNIIDDFGLYFVFHLDVILTNHIAQSIIKIYENFLENFSFVVTFYQQFKTDSKMPKIEEIQSSILPICDEVIKLGAAVVIRRLLRSQAALSCEENIPGFMNVFAQGIKSSLDIHSAGHKGILNLRSEERMLTEIFGGYGGGSRNLFLAVDDEFAFVQSIIQSKNIQQQTNFNAFCIYMSLMLLDDSFNNIKYHPNIDAIDGNVHLFPIAMGAMVDCSNVLFDCFTENSVKKGLEDFYLAFSSIYSIRSNSSDTVSSKEDTCDSLLYLATLFPKYIRALEYERIEETFPLIQMSQILIEKTKNQQLLE